MRMVSKESIHAFSREKLHWDSIDWKTVQKKVKELQMRIAKAVREGKHRLVKSLQWLLTHSFYAKLLAVRRVVTNKGKNTPGVDGEIWNTPKKKMLAVARLNRRDYQPIPLRRVYIKKKNGKRRALGIPTIRDRAMQALYALALAPVAETTGDRNSYGFREYRSSADAIGQCWSCLAGPYSAQWILEADIQACFDSISHKWMLNNILIDRKILQAWLKAGYIDKGKLYPTKAGTPQGGIASPLLANMTLDGLEPSIKAAVPRGSKVNVIRYADDFIVTGGSREILQHRVIPAIQEFLTARGLNLSGEKTKITRIDYGFDFLGQHLRKYGDKYIPTPSKGAVKAIIAKTGRIIKDHSGGSAWEMIARLNQVIRGWANYHRHICSKRTFAHVDDRIFKQIWNWAVRRHKSKGKRWIRNRYFRSVNFRNWSFFATQKTERGASKFLDLFHAMTTKIVRHVKIRSMANPYDKNWQPYFATRRLSKYPARS
jgi:RNA-directed DNA polymerase